MVKHSVRRRNSTGMKLRMAKCHTKQRVYSLMRLRETKAAQLLMQS